MKKLLNWSITYAVLAIIAGVFFREFTKLNGFVGITSLSKIHVHLFALGMIVFLIMMLFEKSFQISQSKYYKKFLCFYNVGVLGAAISLFARGITQVLEMNMSTGLDMSIAGISGIFHIILCIGLLFMFKMIKEKSLT